MSANAEQPRDACGVMGVYAAGGAAAPLVRAGLVELQHRGEESAGVVVAEPRTGRPLRLARAGLVRTALPEAEVDALPGRVAIGHVRYSTSGTRSADGAQPILRVDRRCDDSAGLGVEDATTRRGWWLAVAHNGNLVNTAALAREAGRETAREAAREAARETVREAGPEAGLVAGSTDSTIVADLLGQRCDAGATLEGALRDVLPRLVGSFSLVLTDGSHLIGVRDPNGLRPLVLGRRPDGWVLASETPALEAAGAALVREVEPGEMVVVEGETVRSEQPFPAGTVRNRLCMFEFVYFARPDGTLAGQSVGGARHRAGEALAEHAPPPRGGGLPTIVIPVPSSAVPAAQGYAARAGLPYVEGIARDLSRGRSFLAPEQERREDTVEAKLVAVPHLVAGRRVVVVDDSLVRGTTTRRVVRMLREAGAAEVHLRIASPPWRWPCRLGIDAGDQEDLAAAVSTLSEMSERLGCDSLAYLPLEEALVATGAPPDRFCTGCITGRYPVPVPLPSPRPHHALFADAGRIPEGVPA